MSRQPGLEEDLIKDASGFETTYTFGNVTAQGDWANRIRADGNDLLYIAAGSPDATADWQDVVGQGNTQAGASNQPTGTVGTPTGTVNTPTGVQYSPGGTSDSGGGNDDALILKLFP